MGPRSNHILILSLSQTQKNQLCYINYSLLISQKKKKKQRNTLPIILTIIQCVPQRLFTSPLSALCTARSIPCGLYFKI